MEVAPTYCIHSDYLTERACAQLVLGQHTELICCLWLQALHHQPGLSAGYRNGQPIMRTQIGFLLPVRKTAHFETPEKILYREIEWKRNVTLTLDLHYTCINFSKYIIR